MNIMDRRVCLYVCVCVCVCVWLNTANKDD